MTFGFVSGSALRGLTGVKDADIGLDRCSNGYMWGRVSGTAVTLLANAFGAIPKTLTHYTVNQAAARSILNNGLRSSKFGLFGGGRYASSIGRFPYNPFVPIGSKVPVAITNTSRYIRAFPGTYLQPTASGAAQLATMNAMYGTYVNKDLLKCECGND